MDKQYLTIVYRLPPGYEASQLCQHEHAVVLSWSHMKEDREELRAENEKLKANLDRHMEVIVKGRKANEMLVARLKQIDDYLIERGIYIQLPEGIK